MSTYPKGGKKRKSPSGSSTSAAVGLPTDSSSATEADVKPDIDSSDLESATPTEARKKPRVTKATTATNDDLHSTPKREPSAKVGPSSPGEFTLEKKERLKAMVFMAGLAVFDQKEAAILVRLVWQLPLRKRVQEGCVRHARVS